MAALVLVASGEGDGNTDADQVATAVTRVWTSAQGEPDMRRTLAALMAAGLLVGAGCGGDDSGGADSGGGGSSTEEFCDFYYRYFNTDWANAYSPEEVAETLRNIDPPADIADEWEALADAIEAGVPRGPVYSEAATSIDEVCDRSANDVPSDSVPEP